VLGSTGALTPTPTFCVRAPSGSNVRFLRVRTRNCTTNKPSNQSEVIHLKAAFYARALLLLAVMIVSATFAQTPTVAQPDTSANAQVNPSILELDGFPFAPPVLTSALSVTQTNFPLEKVESNATRAVKNAPENKQITSRKSATNTKPKTRSVKTKLERKPKSFPSMIVRSTAYNSITNQTDSSPFHTSTGVRTRYGIIALSRDLLKRIPYGSRVRLQDNGSWANGRGRGKYNSMLKDTVFVVEDTMHPRKNGQIDVWLPARDRAMQWGVRSLNMQIVQMGR
jgi:3D (Asp-Asp-Asp) domain-containing protein